MLELIGFGLGASYFVGRHDGEAAGREMVGRLLKAMATEDRLRRTELNTYHMGAGRG